jgi:ribosome biogenesis SPOUT family RNA methylase Rps3
MQGKTYVVEHLDPDLGPWSALEYATIAKESHEAGATFCLTSVSQDLVLPEDLKRTQGLRVETESVEVLFADAKPRTCLLDPAAAVELTPEDGERFDIFLFGGILGTCDIGHYVFMFIDLYEPWHR